MSHPKKRKVWHLFCAGVAVAWCGWWAVSHIQLRPRPTSSPIPARPATGFSCCRLTPLRRTA